MCVASFDLVPVISHLLLCVGINTGHRSVAAVLGIEERALPNFGGFILLRFTVAF